MSCTWICYFVQGQVAAGFSFLQSWSLLIGLVLVTEAACEEWSPTQDLHQEKLSQHVNHFLF